MDRRSGGISIFVRESLLFKTRHDLGIKSEALEILSIEILNKKHYVNLICCEFYLFVF